MYDYYFHVKFKRKYTLEQPSVLIICSAISLHLNTTTTGSGVEEDFINKETYGNGDVYDVIDSPIAVSTYAAIAIGAFALKGR